MIFKDLETIEEATERVFMEMYKRHDGGYAAEDAEELIKEAFRLGSLYGQQRSRSLG